ncbi:MAG: hypothetical protein JWN04_4757 [Myxococcaceae bacterium]|nr:hypothetical protein [Myxococcaceae bacterium]
MGFVALLSCLGLVACTGREKSSASGLSPLGQPEASVPVAVPMANALDAAVDAAPAKQDAGPPAPVVKQSRTLQFVAHEDDDLGLMSPDLLGNVQRGDPLRTVYLTSGDAGFTCNEYTMSRERGVRAAYALMAGVADAWDESEQLVRGKQVRVLSLHNTNVSLVFMGLHNGGYGESVAPDLEALWAGKVTQISTRPYDGRSHVDTYTRTELTDVLLQLTTDFAATRVNTLDSSRLLPMIWPFDHSDHVHSALFALAALLRYDAPHTIGMYRAYNSQFELSNVSSEDAATKLAVFQTYLSHDPKVCPGGNVKICGADVPCDLSELYVGYEDRQYRTAVYANLSGLLRGPASQCLQGLVHGDSSTVTLTTCAPKDDSQRFRLPGDSTVRHVESGLCLDASPGTRGSKVELKPCDQTLNQRFVLTTQAQLRGPDSTCVQGDGTTLSLQECALDLRQLNWSPGVYSTIVDRLIDGLTNLDIPDSLSYYGTLSFGDVDGDGDGDICVRLIDGIYCAFAELGSFSDYTQVLDQFGDDSGWLEPEYGATVQLGDIDGDGTAEVCGRGHDGVYCASFSKLLGSFLAYAKRSAGTDFSDQVGYASSVSRYRSLRLIDVDGDGAADLCARNELGIECARSNADGTFQPARQWTSQEFSDANHWNTDASGSTLRYGDVTGDGRADVCGRSTVGVICATNDGAGHFVDPHLWSRTGDFDDKGGWNSQLSYYGSIRLIDIDEDGTKDVCGRSPAGLLCGISTGSAFSVATTLASADAYSDGKGWKDDRYGSTIGLLDLNLDGNPDLCGWGPGADGIGLRCLLADSSKP